MEQLKYTEILQQNKALDGLIKTQPYKISILSNVTINSLKEILEFNCRIHQIEPDVAIGNFDNIVQDSAAMKDRDLVIVMYELFSIIDDMGVYFEGVTDITFEGLQLRLFAEVDLILENLKSCPAVVLNTFSSALFPSFALHKNKAEQLADNLNKYLEEKKQNNVHLADLNKIFMSVGLKQSIDFRFYHSSKAPYTVSFLKEYTLSLQNLILRNNGKLKKALIFDCDNTLWKGILGEDGLTGIDSSISSKAGKPYNMVQQMAASLSTKGIIIGLCSKNNPDDVEEVLLSENSVLKNEHIVIKKVNWQDKATNLKAIASELNIGIDSLVFVDDSPFEINLIKEQLPEILTLQVPASIQDYPEQLQKITDRYFSLEGNKDDAAKTQMYKQQFEREESKNAFGSIEDYLASLEIAVKITKDDLEHVPRIAQLTQKTNQFNLTTIRYTETQIEQLMKNDQDAIFALFVKDKYGDSGLTGICIIRQDEHNTSNAVLDSLLMSCRIIGRNIEHAFLNHILMVLNEKGYKTVSAQYIPTKKNEQVANFYDQKGFELKETTEQGTKNYVLNMEDYHASTIDYITLEFK